VNLDPATITETELVALHEAGHAVVCLLVAAAPVEASVVPTEDTEGHVRFPPAILAGKPELAAVAALAGYIATDLVFGAHWVMREGPAYPDFARARLDLWEKCCPSRSIPEQRAGEIDAVIGALASRIGIEKLAALYARLSTREDPAASALVEREVSGVCRLAEKLLRRVWPKVLAVAAALLERKTLTGAEIQAIVAAASDSPSCEFPPIGGPSGLLAPTPLTPNS
jgi:hypothetical protein